MSEIDVVVVGGGPVGLMLASELKLGGAEVVVLERRTEIDQTIKAGSISIPTAEAFYRRGLLPPLVEVQRQGLEKMAAFLGQAASSGDPSASAPPRIAGHFAGIMVGADLVDLDDPEFRNAGPATNVMMVSQQAIEEILGSWATDIGVNVRRGMELTGFESDPDGVWVEAGGERIRAGWLVGCDGGRSLVRRMAGFDFPGTDPEITGHQALVEMDGVETLGKGWNHTDGGIYVHGPMAGRILTVEFDGPPVDRDAPVTAAELEDSLRATSGVDVNITKIISATRFTDNARQASTYRDGRVLLAGDAAHVHSPFGGQGLNLGIGDAVNLGWKLAATIRGEAADGLLDTYTVERHPIGAWVLEWNRAQVALMRTDPRTRALRNTMSDLLGTVDGATYLAKNLSGVLQRYALPGDHPLIGSVAPDLELADGTRLNEHCSEGLPVVFDLADDHDLRDRLRPWGDRVQVVTGKAAGAETITGLLVRPDGYVAWATESGPPDECLEALRRLLVPTATSDPAGPS